MQVKLGPLVTAAAGSIGGTTFQRSPIATLVRSKPLPTLRRTSKTNPKRAYLLQWSQRWRTLSNGDRQKWQDAADLLVWQNKFGDEIRGLGYWLYLRCNMNLSTGSFATLTVPEIPFAFTALSDLAAYGSLATSLFLSFTTPAPVQTSTAWYVFATPPASAGRSQASGRYRLIRFVAAGSTTPVNIGAAYNTAFGTSQTIGSRTFIRVQVVDNKGGYIGPIQQVSMVWT